MFETYLKIFRFRPATRNVSCPSYSVSRSSFGIDAGKPDGRAEI